ncbi:MAG TPA: YgiQ family radical SAM protein [Bacilli bacterium]|nr:YgiQ family radical SAM protein [Bacilli bacterium]
MFLPISKKDLNERNIETVDFVLISGDAYVDHPSFGVAIISRVLETQGYTVAILPQPKWEIDDDFLQFGTPNLGFLITSGNLDSIVNNYTVSKRRRDKDSYSEGGKIGLRPDFAVTVYSNIVRRLFPESPIILGGIEASLRRLAHYDYLQNRLKKSILIDSKADIICYGMSDKTIVEVADALKSGLSIKDIIYLRGTTWLTKDKELLPKEHIFLPSYKEIARNKYKYAESFNIQYNNTDPINGEVLVEEYDEGYIVQNTSAMPLEREYLDWVYSLNYERTYHPIYKEPIPAIEEVKFSIAINRGCMGSCSFCALTSHQGRMIQSRSKESVLEEAKKIIEDKDFKGYIHDIGGPTANFYVRACDKQEEAGACKDKKCLSPNKCKNLVVSHKEYLEILREVRSLDKIKKVFIRSGIRYDYLMYDKNEEFFEELVQHHISGQLKVAPEHVSSRVLDYMQKPHFDLYEKFSEKYYELNQKFDKNQFLVPYLMSSHPGCELTDAIELAEYLHKNRIHVEQAQDFYPTPGTLSTCMYYTEIDPRTMKKIFVAKTGHEKAMQRALIQYNKENNYALVKEALELTNRKDLIGNTSNCLIKYKKTFNKH